MRKNLALLFFCFLFIFAIGCGSKDAKRQNNPKNVAFDNGEQKSEILNYGNGVYYFPYIQDDFANALSAFRGQYPELELITITPIYDPNTVTTVLKGYLVCFKKQTKGMAPS